jgi:hypothetical protein
MNFLSILSFLEGKKTYITAFLTAALGLAQAFGYSAPAWVYTILAAAGVTTVRLAIANASK